MALLTSNKLDIKATTKTLFLLYGQSLKLLLIIFRISLKKTPNIS